jgi:hypothetical protein
MSAIKFIAIEFIINPLSPLFLVLARLIILDAFFGEIKKYFLLQCNDRIKVIEKVGYSCESAKVYIRKV